MAKQHPVPKGNTRSAKDLLKGFKKIQREHPRLTAGVRVDPTFHAKFQNIADPNVQQPAAANRDTRTLLVDPNYRGPDKSGAYERFVAAHELGHINETRLVRNPQRAALYASLAGTPQPAPQGTVDKQGVHWGTPAQVPPAFQGDPTHASEGELYASDVAAALGQNAGTSTQVQGAALRALQYLRILPKGVGYGRGITGGRGDALAVTPGQAQALAANQSRIYAGMPKRKSAPPANGKSPQFDFINFIGRLKNDANPRRIFTTGHGVKRF